jgi:hypothetical protein
MLFLIYVNLLAVLIGTTGAVFYISLGTFTLAIADVRIGPIYKAPCAALRTSLFGES